jgi:hypothetical protein
MVADNQADETAQSNPQLHGHVRSAFWLETAGIMMQAERLQESPRISR